MAGSKSGGPERRPGPLEYAVAIFTAVVLVLAFIGLAILILCGP